MVCSTCNGEREVVEIVAASGDAALVLMPASKAWPFAQGLTRLARDPWAFNLHAIKTAARGADNLDVLRGFVQRARALVLGTVRAVPCPDCSSRWTVSQVVLGMEVDGAGGVP